MTSHHHPELKPKMGKARNQPLPGMAPESNPDPSRPGPELSPKTGRDTRSAQSGQGTLPTRNPQTSKPGLNTPPAKEPLPKKGTDIVGHGAKQGEEDKNRPGMHQPQAAPHLPGNVKK